MSEIILDTETTGLSVKDGHRILEIACIETENLIPTKRVFYKLINPEREISADASRIHGYTYEILKNKEYTIKKLSTENKELYGSVKPTEISNVLKEIEKIDVNPSMIQPNKEIKSLGSFQVNVNLHSEVQSEIKIKVIAEEEV